MDNRDILLTPIKIGEHTCQNRFFSQPMECNDADPEGNPTDLTYQRYENLFRGEAAMVCLEAITITDKNRGRMNQLFIMPKNQPALEKFIRRLREVRPDISISSDFIVGFPGETRDDFQATLDLVEEIGFDQSFSFIYSSENWSGISPKV